MAQIARLAGLSAFVGIEQSGLRALGKRLESVLLMVPSTTGWHCGKSVPGAWYHQGRALFPHGGKSGIHADSVFFGSRRCFASHASMSAGVNRQPAGVSQPVNSPLRSHFRTVSGVTFKTLAASSGVMISKPDTSLRVRF